MVRLLDRPDDAIPLNTRIGETLRASAIGFLERIWTRTAMRTTAYAESGPRWRLGRWGS